MRTTVLTWVASVCLAGAAWAQSDPPAGSPTAPVQDEEARKRMAELEKRVQELEAEKGKQEGGLPEWLKHFRISASANAGFYEGEEDSYYKEGTFDVIDARLFVEADLGQDVTLGGTKILRDIGFLFEWDLVRLSSLANRVGELYVDFQGLFDSEWVNFQIGRFQLPVSENYLRFSKGWKDNPFVTSTLGAPWYWDEGIRIYGADATGRYGYVASVSDGETSFNGDRDADKQLTLKLFGSPIEGLRISASYLRSGHLGTPTTAAGSGVWFGESFIRQYGGGTTLTNFNDGVALADGPTEINNVEVMGVDLVLSHSELVRAWLAYGLVDVNQDGPSVYNRELEYWVAEVVVHGALLSPGLEPFYLGLRADAWGSRNDDEGYLLDLRYSATLGYNMERMLATSIVLGWKVTKNVTLRTQYTIMDIDVVGGVTPAIEDAAKDANFYAIEVMAAF